VTFGPTSHSPPQIAEAPITRPGLSIANQFLQVNVGVTTNSPVVQRGISFAPGCGASDFAAAEDSGEPFDFTVDISPRRFA
jgi:hypothetical protein